MVQCHSLDPEFSFFLEVSCPGVGEITFYLYLLRVLRGPKNEIDIKQVNRKRAYTSFIFT